MTPFEGQCSTPTSTAKRTDSMQDMPDFGYTPSEDEAAQLLASTVASAASIYAEALTPVRESTIGYRRGLIAAGFSDESAESCAVQFHRVMLALIGPALMPQLNGGTS